MKSGNLNFLELSGPVQACNGSALTLPYYCMPVDLIMEQSLELQVTFRHHHRQHQQDSVFCAATVAMGQFPASPLPFGSAVLRSETSVLRFVAGCRRHLARSQTDLRNECFTNFNNSRLPRCYGVLNFKYSSAILYTTYSIFLSWCCVTFVHVVF
jgi:hypothetical protein